MKALVAVKRVIDYNVKIRVKQDNSGVEKENVKMSMNPFDEIALEEALRMKERGDASEVIVMSIGSTDAQQQLRTGLAMGADRAILVETDNAGGSLNVARAFKAIVGRDGIDLVMLGKQAIDGDNSQTAQMLAAIWGRPQATFASKIELDGNVATVTREVDAGLEVLQIDLPAVVSVDLRMNEPRYVKLPDIMKAKRVQIEATNLGDLGVEAAPAIKVTKTAPPPARSKGIMVKTVDELAAMLKQKGLV